MNGFYQEAYNLADAIKKFLRTDDRDILDNALIDFEIFVSEHMEGQDAEHS